MFTKSTVEKLQQYKTPIYYYDLDLLDKTLFVVNKEAKKYNYHVHYALKANTNPRILKHIQENGFGADCVSGNEIKRSIEIGFPSDKIVFAGVGKSDDEIQLALDNNIFCFNCESIHELEVINEIAASQNKIAPIALRINPNVDAQTHKYITTGLEENKFGINAHEFNTILEKLMTLKNIELKGAHFHIGSQITDLKPFKTLCIRVNEINQWFLNRGYDLQHINVGGGLGINYKEPDTHAIVDFSAYFKVFSDFIKLRPHQQLHFELGRSMVAQCGALISKVLYIKQGINTNFAILDAGMTELIRPALYQAFHKIENLSANIDNRPIKFHKYDVVGPICESSDCFGKSVILPQTQRNDFMAIRSTGAYGEVMSSNYNLREKAISVFSTDL